MTQRSPSPGSKRRFPSGENGRLLREVEAAGLTVRHGRKHWKIFAEDGRLLAVVGNHRGNGPDQARAALRRNGVL